MLIAPACAASPPIRVCLIGDSITVGTKYGPSPAANLQAAGFYVINRGFGGSGTKDWLPGSALLEGAKADCTKGKTTVASIMLGANDASRAEKITPAVYRENMAEIVAYLTAAGFRVIVNDPPPILAASKRSHFIDRLPAYAREIDALGLPGDHTATAYMAEHAYLMAEEGVHINALGAAYLSIRWAEAIQAAAAAP